MKLQIERRYVHHCRSTRSPSLRFHQLNIITTGRPFSLSLSLSLTKVFFLFGFVFPPWNCSHQMLQATEARIAKQETRGVSATAAAKLKQQAEKNASEWAKEDAAQRKNEGGNMRWNVDT